MATNVILPALGMAQESGKIVRWLKAEGDEVARGEPLAEIETDKATVELEASAAGVLAAITAVAGDEVPVGQIIARILAPGEAPPPSSTVLPGQEARPAVESGRVGTPVSPLAARIAAEHKVDVAAIKPAGKRIEKADVLAHLQQRDVHNENGSATPRPRLMAASPRARRLAQEQGRDLGAIQGTGPGGAILTADVLANAASRDWSPASAPTPLEPAVPGLDVSTTWRIMAERTTQSWTSVPHFFLVREINASRLIDWREQTLKRSATKVTFTDLLVKVVAMVLREHPRLNATWREGRILLNEQINVGLAVATEQGLVVPVLQQADALSVTRIAEQRQQLVARAQAGKVRPEDLSGGTFTISNLGMYGVDAFNAIINQPQAAILAVGRIAERVVPVKGQPAVQPMLTLSLSCDHRVVDGARGARFLENLADLLEEPLGLLA